MKKQIKILAIAVFALCIGTTVAYYNTASLGYDNANIVSFDEEQIKILDFDIKYEEIEQVKEKISKYFPKDFITI